MTKLDNINIFLIILALEIRPILKERHSTNSLNMSSCDSASLLIHIMINMAQCDLYDDSAIDMTQGALYVDSVVDMVQGALSTMAAWFTWPKVIYDDSTIDMW